MTLPFTPSEVRELYAKASGLYSTIVSLTSTPLEGAEIICMIHLMMYLNNGDGKTNVDDMLAAYCRTFKVNWESQVEMGKGELN